MKKIMNQVCLSKGVYMFNIKKLLKDKEILSSKSIEITNSDSELMELCHKLGSLKKGLVITNEEFKKSQVQNEFKEIMTLFIRSVYKKDFKEVIETFESIDSLFNNLGTKKEQEEKEIERLERINVLEKELEIKKEEVIKEVKEKEEVIKKEIKSDIEEMEDTFKLQKRTPTKGKK